jgi:GNAT superfamily N-acetyltransferase
VPAPDWTVRPGFAADLPALVDFNLAMARETEGRELDRTTLTAGVAAALADPVRGRYLVAEHAGTLLGCLMLTAEWSDWRNGELWWIQSVYVAPQWRGRGVFRSLFSEAQAAATAAGAAGLRLYVEEHNQAARAVYERLGMKPAGYVVLERCPPE